jgi:hypothetical protein
MPTGGRLQSPWSEAELLTLLGLLEEFKKVREPPSAASAESYLTTLAGLMSLSGSPPVIDGETPKPVTAPLWDRLEQNPLYLRMCRNRAFKLLLAKFREVMGRRLKMEKGAHAEFEFIYWVLLSGQFYYQRKAQRDSRHYGNRKGTRRQRLGEATYSEQRKAVRKLIADLNAYRSNGVRLTSHQDEHRLSALLSQLDMEMSRTRKRRETDRTPATDALKLLARMLYLRFKLSSPVILKYFDGWLGTEINETTIHKIGSAAKREVEAELASSRGTVAYKQEFGLQ